MVVAHDHGAVRVAEDNLRTHVDELVGEEEAALEHLLVEEHAALRLGGHHQQHRQQVGGEAGPGGVGYRHDGAVDKRLHLIVVVIGYPQIVVLLLHLHAQPAEGVGDDAQVAHRHIVDAYAVAHHGGHADERPHLDHVGQQGVLGAVQAVCAHDGEQVGGDAAYLGSHAVEHVAELLDIGLAGGVVDGGGALGQHRRHDDVGGAGHRGLVEQHVAAPQPVGRQLEYVATLHTAQCGAQIAEAQEVGVETAASYLVAAGLGHHGAVETGQQRTYHEHAAAQGGALAHKLVALQIVEVQVVGLEDVGAVLKARHLHPDVLQQQDEVLYIQYLGDVLDVDGLAREQRGANHLKGLVLGALGLDAALQRVAAFYDE